MAPSSPAAAAAGRRTRLLESRVDREVFIESLVNKARWVGVVLGIVQFGFFSDYLPGVRPVGLAIGLGYGVVAAWSSRELRRRAGDLERLRRLTTTTLATDSAMLATTALVLAYQDDPTNLFLMVLPMLEAAMKRQLPGAMALTAAAISVEVGRVLLRVRVHDLPVEPANSTFFAGMLLIIGLFVGGMVRLQVAAQEQLARSNDRLEAMRQLLRSGLDSFSGGTGLQQILQEAVEGLALRCAVVRTPGTAPVAWPPGAAREAVVDVVARELVPGTVDEVDHVDGKGRRWRALPLAEAADGTAALVVGLADAEGAVEDADALHAELRAVIRASAALAVEDEMRAARASLDRLRHDVVAITTHEIRTPVTVIKAAVETMRRSVAPGREHELLAAVAGASDRLEDVVENLQVIQRLDEGDFGTKLANVDVGAVLLDVANLVGDDDVEVARLGAAIAWADAKLVHTVLKCLVENALTHGNGSDVRVDAFVDGGDVVVDVSDAGPGIPAQARQRVFERFAAASAVHHHRGAGIGLPLARELARLMDGDVALLDEERTTFRFRLPRAAA